MFTKLLDVLARGKQARVHQVALLGLEPNTNYDPSQLMIKGLRNVTIVDNHYLIEHHEAIAKRLKDSYPDV